MIKKVFSGLSALLLSLSSLFVFAPTVAHAAAITWDGGGSDNNFNTAENWAGDVVPADGDSIVLDNTGLLYDDTLLTNNISDLSLAGITVQGSGAFGFTIDGSAITLTGTVTDSASSEDVSNILSLDVAMSGDKTINVPASHSLSIYGSLTGSGGVTKTGSGVLYLSADNSSYTGALVISAGRLFVLSANGIATSGGTTVADGADVSFISCDETPFAGSLTLTGASSQPSGDSRVPKLYTAVSCSGGGGAPDETYGLLTGNSTATLSGSITLGSDITFKSYAANTKLTGPLSGNHTINLFEGGAFKLSVESSSNSSGIANGQYSAPQLAKTLADDLATTSVGIYGNTVVTITGKRGDIFLLKGGTLKGTGTVGAVSVAQGSYIASGLSPGCLNTGALSIDASTMQAEIGGTEACSGYDQTRVTGTVALANDAALQVSRYNSYKPKAGEKYTIISNDGADAVTGTFKNLAENATFTVDGYVLRISYVGGDGNDVSLTVVSVPAAPDTGFGMLLNNPAALLATTTVAAFGILLISRRLAPKKVRR